VLLVTEGDEQKESEFYKYLKYIYKLSSVYEHKLIYLSCVAMLAVIEENKKRV
jgi:hypothetical protein